MEKWETDFHNVGIRYSEHLVQIRTDAKLMKYLAEPGNGSLELADYIRDRYQIIFNEKLQISRESLSVEILIHAYLDVFSRGTEKLSVILPGEIKAKLVKCMQSIEGHTQIIDSGELAVDSNRHIFDSLVPYRQALYLMLGKNA